MSTHNLSADDRSVIAAVAALYARGRTVNSSQLSSRTGLSRPAISRITTSLELRGYLRDAGKGTAHHWRVTGKHEKETTS